MDKILVINPNSTEAVTRGIDEACAPLRMPGGPQIECATLKDGPPGIETQQHVDSVVSPLVKLVKEKKEEFSAFVIACYSDPGLHAAREATKKPVLGISECGILTALTLGQNFGRMMDVGKRLRDEHGADVIVMGCAGMARYRKPLQEAVGIPVVEPTQAAVTMAIGRVRLGWESG